ncbi:MULTISPECIES: hypothetical protein [Streptomyces]|uniref:hypothetical protein n=1 Tax=Streptomyces TaxID=1883 RepID=UPI00345B5192
MVGGINGLTGCLLLLAISTTATLLTARRAPLLAAGTLLVIACGIFPAFAWFGQLLLASLIAAIAAYLLDTALEQVQSQAAAILLLTAVSTGLSYIHQTHARPWTEQTMLPLTTVVFY